MKTETFVVTYARTLLEAAEEKGDLEAVREEADFFAHFLEVEPRLRLFLESPRVETDEKLEVLSKTLKGKTSDTLYKFVLLVVRNGRASSLDEIFEEFRVLYDEKIGLVHVNVTTAVPLEADVREQLQTTLEKRLDKRVELESEVDAEILGGMVVRFSGMVADSSLRTAVDEIGQRMSSLKLGSELVHEN